MAWLFLILAGFGEIIGVMGIGRWNERKDGMAWLLLIGGFTASFVLLSISMKSLSMGTAYAVWTGIGTVGSAIVGMLLFGESRDWKRLLFIAMVLSAAVGLKLID